jgi:DNA-binding response OmpR family regulator
MRHDEIITAGTEIVAGDDAGADVTALTFMPDPATILIVERDADCADALQTLLADVPGVGLVHTAGSASDAIELVAGDNDVTAYNMSAAATVATPDVIFIDAQLQTPEASMVEEITSLRRAAPDASIILLCLYPHVLRDRIHSAADRCVRKDTSYRELRALVGELLSQKRQANLACSA